MIRKLLFILIFIFFAGWSSAQRIKQSINTNWSFYKGEIEGYPNNRAQSINWETINLPHTWNAHDVTDEVPGYYRGTGWYHKMLYVPSVWKGKSIYLHFEGANQVARVFVNGNVAGSHTGGYTAFNIPVDKFLSFNSDSMAVAQIDIKLNNAHNEDIPPLDADFSFYGGIYRDVYLMAVDPVHFDISNGADNIKINTDVNAISAQIHIAGRLSNESDAGKELRVISQVFDAAGKQVAEAETALMIDRHASADFKQELLVVNPHLWSPDDAYLYRVESRIVDAATGKELDRLSNPLGLRWFNFSGPEGFTLNGKHLKLIGACRHQDYQGLGNALPDELHVRDMELFKNMGANFIRIAHYPQDPAILEACDRLGILASVEIPIVDRITETQAFTNNCKQMQTEMIRQNYNHPSVVIWAYMNEVMIIPRYNDNTPERKLYFDNIVKLAQTLDSLTHHEDPARYTMISCNGDFNRYFNSGLAKVPQIVGWNLYFGWYEKNLTDLDKFLERHHRELPEKPLIITEFGADADSRLRTLNPQRFDKTIDYQLLYHRYYLNAIKRLPYVTGATIWNFADFNAERRQEATPHVNTKGMLTGLRKPKETYYFYQANLANRPVLHIGANEWDMRSGVADKQGRCLEQVAVYSNCGEVSLYNNQQLIDAVKPQDGVAMFNVPFTNGENQLRATALANGKTLEDFTTVDFKILPQNLQSAPFTSLNISLGDQRYFMDDQQHQLWVPEQPYTKGSWGYIGGEVFKVPGSLPYGSGREILGTALQPVYQTQRVGLSAFKLDVPDGVYELTLYFAELLTTQADKPLVYNLNNNVQQGSRIERDFDVSVNGAPFINHLSAENYLQERRAYATKTTIQVQGGQGIEIDFKANKGQAVLNALQVRKVY